MWAQPTPPQLPQKRGRSRSRPYPFQRDVGGLLSLDGRMGEGDTQEGTKEVGGPTGTSRQRTTTFVVVRFHHSFAALTIFIPNASTTVQRRRVAPTQRWRTGLVTTQQPGPPTGSTPHNDATDSTHDNPVNAQPSLNDLHGAQRGSRHTW